MTIDRLNEVNDIKVYSVNNPEFLSYGRIVSGYNFSSWITYMEQQTDIPANGNVYVASVPEMEKDPMADLLRDGMFGSMEIQVGYCNGRNTTYNGFEYHKGSEINIAITDFMLVLGHIWDIRENTCRTEEAKVFFVERGTAIEMYQTTLHLSPCRVQEEGFRDIVVLPKGTNTPLENKITPVEPEGVLLLMKNKWVLSHPEREPLIRQGAHPGLMGENKELYY